MPPEDRVSLPELHRWFAELRIELRNGMAETRASHLRMTDQMDAMREERQAMHRELNAQILALAHQTAQTDTKIAVLHEAHQNLEWVTYNQVRDRPMPDDNQPLMTKGDGKKVAFMLSAIVATTVFVQKTGSWLWHHFQWLFGARG